MDYKLGHLFAYFESKPKRYCNRLAEACDYKSISKFVETREECFKMVEWFGWKMQELGIEVILRKVGLERRVPSNEYIPLPRVIIGKLGDDVTKKTVLVYGHLDVDPIDEMEGWEWDPFDLIEVAGKLTGRGPSDDKGPCVAWLNVIEAFKKLQISVPINLKFLFECHQESGSEGFRSLLIDEKHKFLKNVDFVVISDNYWLGDDVPCITYGLRGICYYFVEIQCSHYDLHSGVYGGCIAEAMADLVYILNALRDYNGNVNIPHFYDKVEKLTQAELQKFYSSITFNCAKVADDVGARSLLFKSKEENLLGRWRAPWITVHGVEGAWDKPGAKCNIPHKVIGKFSIRVVPNQDPDEISKLTVDFIERLHQERGSPNALRVIPFRDGHPFIGDPEDPNYMSARRAVQRAWDRKPDLTREGASIPVVSMIQRTLEKSIALIPIGQGSDKVHWKNEKLSRYHYIQGCKVIAAYLFEIADLVLPNKPGHYSVGMPKPSPALRFFESKLSHYNS